MIKRLRYNSEAKEQLIPGGSCRVTYRSLVTIVTIVTIVFDKTLMEWQKILRVKVE